MRALIILRSFMHGRFQTGPRLTDKFIMALQKLQPITIFYSNSVYLSDRVTAQKGDHIR